MNDDDVTLSDRILFHLGILDLERLLIEKLEKAGHIDGNTVANWPCLLDHTVRELAVQADLPDHPGVHACVECGTLSVIGMLCEVLIARDLLDAQSLIEATTRKAKFWRSKGSVYRALPAEFLRDGLLVVAAEKKDVDLMLTSLGRAVAIGRANVVSCQ
jgi:hypothetical protein